MLFVGLGNPGSAYEDTRHNIGFKVIDKLASSFGARDISKSSFQGELAKHGTLHLLKPTTFMNLSGKSVQAVKNFYKIDMDKLIVIHDDIDLPFGAVKFKIGGSDGGHNGLKSIDSLVGREYIRVRIGIGRPEYRSQVSDYVLSKFDTQQSEKLDDLVDYVTMVCQKLATTELKQIKSLYSIKSIEKLEG